MKTKNPSTVAQVEQLATRLWKRSNTAPGRAFEAWRNTQHHLWGVADGLFIAGKPTAAYLADELGFFANARAQLALEQGS